MKDKIKLGTKVEDWYNGKKVGTYVISRIPSFEQGGDDRYALISLNGEGLGNGYFVSLEKLREVVLNDSSWVIVDRIND